MICQNCSHNNSDNADFCVRCGAPLMKVHQVKPQQVFDYKSNEYRVQSNSPFGTISLIFGIMSMIPCCFFYHYVPAIIAIITGIVELTRINRGYAPMTNRSKAMVGLILGIIAFSISMIIFIFSIFKPGSYKYPTYDV